jgi:hypothetical protein
MNSKESQPSKTNLIRKKAQEATDATRVISKKVTDWAETITFYPGRIAKHVWENEFALT